MPKIYIFHKLLQQGILQCYGPINHPVWPIQAHSLLLYYGVAHTLDGKINLITFTMKGSMVLREMGITIDFSESSLCSLIKLLVLMKYTVGELTLLTMTPEHSKSE